MFEAVPTKLPHYTLPLMPALCVLGATWAVSATRAPPKWFSVPVWALFGVAAVVLGLGAAILPFVARPEWSWTLLLGIPALAAMVLLVWRTAKATGKLERCLAALACMPLVIWGVLGIDVAHDSPLWIAPRIAAIRDAISPDAPLATVGFAEPSLPFLAGTSTLLLSGGAAGAQFLADGPGRVLAVESRDLAAFNAANHVTSRIVGEVDGFNYSNGHHVAITMFAD